MKNTWVVIVAVGITAFFIGGVMFFYKPEYRSESSALICSGVAVWVFALYLKKKQKK